MLKTSMNLRPQWIEKLEDEKYHAANGYLSSTALRKLTKSPHTFREYMLAPEQPDSLNKRIGRLAHEVILGGPSALDRFIVQPDFGDLRTKAAKEAKSEWMKLLPENAEIITAAQREMFVGMVNSITNHNDASNLLRNGRAEHSGFFADPETNICCKIRPDFLPTGIGALVELKTASDISQHAFANAIKKFGYHIQTAMYEHGIRVIDGTEIEHIAFIVVEKTPPFECAVYVMSRDAKEQARREFRSLMGTLGECLASDNWPRFQPRVQEISLPTWAMNEG